MFLSQPTDSGTYMQMSRWSLVIASIAACIQAAGSGFPVTLSASEAARAGRVMPQAGDSLLLLAAFRIAEAAPALSELWPGYWPSSQCFIIALPRVRVLLITDQ